MGYRWVIKIDELGNFVRVGGGVVDEAFPPKTEMKYIHSVVDPAGMISVELLHRKLELLSQAVHTGSE